MTNVSQQPLSTDDYRRIADAIHWIDEHIDEQPTSGEMASAAGLSDAYFSRLFRRWAGIAPGRYLKHRTELTAARALATGASVLDAALTSGLSGPGRLHDLMVSVDAMSPGEYKSGGAGLTLRYGTGVTPFGQAFVLVSARGIVELTFIDAADVGDGIAAARQRWSAANFEPLADTAALLRRVFFGGAGEITLNPVGTNFQIKVWRALLGVPAGEPTSYGAVATALGAPKGARAVGNAVGANNIAFLIPCHRVLRANGALGDYRWGAPRKRAILAWEHCRQLASAAD